MRGNMRAGGLFSVALVLSAAGASAQKPILLESPDARSAEPFSLLRDARELPDGRLLVTDWIEQRVAVVDLERGTVEDRGRIGAGPGEFRLPAGLLAFRGDSSLLVDLGNGRLTVLDENGRLGRSFQPRDAAARAPRAADAEGRLYFTIPPWLADRPLPGDTVELVAWDPATQERRTLVRVHGSRRPSSDFAPIPRVPFVVFAAQDTWTAGPEGRIAIVREDGYRVEWLSGGRTVAGPSYGGAAQPVRPADRTAFVRSFLESSPVSGRGEDGGLGLNPASSLSRESIEQMVEGSEFAETLPVFRAGDVRIDSAGRLWVGLHSRDGEARRYDVFDSNGVRTTTVALRAGRHLLAVGRAHVYVVRTEDDGLQTIERYAMPGVL